MAIRNTNHPQATMPNSHDAKAGVRWRRLISASFSGPALWDPIDSIERAAGRMVVWVLAIAEVSTARISSLLTVLPSTTSPTAPRASSGLSVRNCGPLAAWAPMVTTT